MVRVSPTPTDVFPLILTQLKLLTGGLALLVQVRVTLLPTDTGSVGWMEAEVFWGETDGEGTGIMIQYLFIQVDRECFITQTKTNNVLAKGVGWHIGSIGTSQDQSLGKTQSSPTIFFKFSK